MIYLTNSQYNIYSIFKNRAKALVRFSWCDKADFLSVFLSCTKRRFF